MLQRTLPSELMLIHTARFGFDSGNFISHVSYSPRIQPLQEFSFFWKLSCSGKQCRYQGNAEFSGRNQDTNSKSSQPVGNWLKNRERKDLRQRELSSAQCLYVKRNIRQFEDIEHNGTIIIFGDVSAGAKLKARGDVMIFGRLMGEAHAGKDGDCDASVIAILMEPTVLTIANQSVSVPKHDNASIPFPEIARLTSSGNIVLKPLPHWPQVELRRDPAELSVEETILQQSAVNPSHVQWTHMEEQSPRQAVKVGKTTKLAIATGCYISAVGLGLFFFPRAIFGMLFDLNSISKGWVQVFGVLCLMFGFYYCGAGLGEVHGIGVRGFYLSTVVGRLVLFFMVCFLVATGAVQWQLLLLGVVNLLGALSMFLSMRV